MKNRTMIRVGLAGLLAAGVLVASLPGAENRPRRPATQAFMRQKLFWYQGVMEGLTLEKFDLVSKNAIRLRDMTQSNQWFTIKQPDYLAHTTNFHKAVDTLYLAAVDKKLDAPTEAYVNVTRSCVECHRLVRQEQRRNAGQPLKPRSDVEVRPLILP
jgi:hypothetical protein